MILRYIRVEGWRVFAAPFTIGPLADGINLIHAPNGSGKSTLFHALLEGLTRSFRATGREIQSFRTRGHSLTPKVYITFEAKAGGYRISKRFLDRPIAVLEQRRGTRWYKIAEEDAAEEQMREAIGAPEAALKEILWTPQGGLELAPLSGDLAADIRAALGAQAAGPEGVRIEHAVDEVYLSYFTDHGRDRSGRAHPMVRLNAEVASLTEEFTQVSESWRRVEDDMRRLEQIGARQVALAAELERSDAALKAARDSAAQWQALDARHRALEQKARAERERFNRLRSQIDEVTRGERALAEPLPTLTLSTGGIVLEIEPLHDGSMRVEQGSPAGERLLTVGRTYRVEGGPIELVIPGFGRIRATSQAAEQLAAARVRLEANRREWVERLTAIRSDGLTDAARAEELHKAELDYRAAQAEFAAVETELKRVTDASPARIAELERTRQRAAVRAEQNREEYIRVETAIRVALESGLYSRLAEVEEHLAAAVARLASERRRAEAVKLLKFCIDEAKLSATESVQDQVAASASRILAAISGGGEGLTLGGGFAPAGIESEDGVAALATASGGEREQVHFAARLALGEVLAGDERQLAIFDDALTATDSTRMRRVVEALNAAAGRLQILILTCHPERYAGLEGGKRIDLAKVAKL